jgi:hypothetical protein
MAKRWSEEDARAFEAVPPEKFGVHDPDVYEWRLKELLARGVPQVTAEYLARSGVDLGEMRDLLDEGCPPMMLLRIVL